MSPFRPATGAEAAGLYWGLTLDHHLATLSAVAPYDTMQLVATPRDAHGRPLAGLGPVTFRSSDPERVQVTADGLVRALKAGNEVVVTAELATGNVKHSDELFLDITDDSTPPVIAHVSIQPPDSTRWAMTGDGAFLFISGNGSASSFIYKWWPSRVTDAEGSPIPGLLTECTSSDTTVAWAGCDVGLVFLRLGRPGRVILTAAATAYGVTVADTVAFAVTMPAYGVVTIKPRAVSLGENRITFGPTAITISPGGTVVWANVSGQPVDIVFEDPTNVVAHGAVSCANANAIDQGGVSDISAFGELQDPNVNLSAENCRSRRFPVAGVFPYHSTITGATGRVVVTDGISTP